MSLRTWLSTMIGVPTVKAIRGAISVPSDDPVAIREAVLELLHELRTSNQLEDCEIVSAIFTVTPDLVSAFPSGAHQGNIPATRSTRRPVGAMPCPNPPLSSVPSSPMSSRP